MVYRLSATVKVGSIFMSPRYSTPPNFVSFRFFWGKILNYCLEWKDKQRESQFSQQNVLQRKAEMKEKTVSGYFHREFNVRYFLNVATTEFDIVDVGYYKGAQYGANFTSLLLALRMSNDRCNYMSPQYSCFRKAP